MRSGNSRTIVQAHQTAALVQVALGRADEARALLEPIVGILEEFTNFPPQTLALVESIRAGIAMLEHDLDGAESHLRVAAKEAIASHDQPIMGLVAINIGTLALRRDEVVRALEAVDIAAVLIGAHDATHPQVVEIERVAAERGIGRDSAASSRSALTRPKAIEELERLA
jgi:hypothetical protein